MKRFFYITLTIFFMLSLCSSVIFASGGGSPYSAIHKAYTKDTLAQNIVKVTRPDQNETTKNKTFTVCGYAKKSGVSVELLVYNSKSGVYEYVENEDGDIIWDVGASGIFQYVLQLKGTITKVRVFAYKDSSLEEPRQITNLTIKYDEPLFEKIKNGMFDFFNDMLKR